MKSPARLRNALGWCVVAAVSVAGCTRSDQPIVAVHVRQRSGIGVAGSERPDDRAVEQRAQKALAPLGFVAREAREGEVGWQLSITVQLTSELEARPDAQGEVALDQAFRQAAVTLDLRPLSSDAAGKLPARHVGSGQAGRNAKAADGFEGLVGQAIDDAARDVAAELELLRASDREVVSRIGSKDFHRRSRAIEAAGERRLTRALPPLIEILKDESVEPSLVFKTIGALIKIGDERAVGPLIDSARQRPPMYLGQIIFGVAQIGGREAEAYLFTVASGHADPEVRANAKDALEELERRRGAGEQDDR